MKKIVSITLFLAIVLATLTLSSCNIINKVENAVIYPETYSITYEITTAEGLVHTITKTVDENGNVYFKNMDAELLFLNNNGTYTLYQKDTTGAFSETSGAKFTRQAVEKEVALFDRYAKQSTNKFIPTTRLAGETSIAGRTAETYKIGVNLLAVSFYHFYYVDSQTGICLGVEAINTTFGNEAKANEESFVCVEFLTQNIENLANKI